MSLFELIALIITLAAGFSYLNLRLLKLPSAIGLMALTLGFSLVLLIIGAFSPDVTPQARSLIERLALDEALLHGMLGFLLFAGALHIDLDDLARDRWPIAVLATIGVIISTAIVGVLMWGVFVLLGSPLRMIDCLLFGALISPTDPIAVLGLLKQIGAPRRLSVQIAGESLFNDGVGVALFLGLLEVALSGNKPEVGHFALIFLRETAGGAIFGLAIGLLANQMLKTVDHYQVEIMLSLALVAGGYAAAEALHLSGAIAMVVAGIVVGNQGRRYAMSAKTKEHLDLFWELVDEILNAILFVLIGLELIVLDFTLVDLAAGLAAIVVVLFARLVAVGLPMWVFRRWEPFEPSTVPILTWGGLRGGISVALALSLPGRALGGGDESRALIVGTTYSVMVFSILVQGLTVGPLTRRWLAAGGHVVGAVDGAAREPSGPELQS